MPGLSERCRASSDRGDSCQEQTLERARARALRFPAVGEANPCSAGGVDPARGDPPSTVLEGLRSSILTTRLAYRWRSPSPADQSRRFASINKPARVI